jgi:uncharacterized repeat protein (TIGR02059 family)
MATVNGTPNADIFSIESLNGRNGGTYDINGLGGNDVLSLTVPGNSSYDKKFPLSRFTIGAAVGGVITITGSSSGGAAFTFHLTSVETLEYYDSATKSYKTMTLDYGTPPPAGDTTAPVFSSATANGSILVLTYTDANNLNAANPPAAGAFSVSGGHGVNGVAVDAAAKTVTLTLATPVANAESVTISYTDPTSGNDANAIQDAAGNDAASLVSAAVVNNTPAPAGDTNAPVFGSATVNGSTLVLTYTDANNLNAANPPAAGAFSVSGGHGVNGVAVDAAAKTVTLTLATPANAIQDAAGNDAASLVSAAVVNNTPAPAPGDTTPPVFGSASVNGSTLVLTYSDVNNLDAAHAPSGGAFAVSGHTVSGVAVSANTVTLTLATGVAHGEAVTVAYTDPTSGNDVNAVQDVAGNDAASLAATAVTNNTPVPVPGDTASPVFASAAVNGSTLVLSYTDANNLDASHAPAAGAFSVSGHTVSSVAVDAGAKTVSLTLETGVAHGEVVTVAYTEPTTGNDVNAIQDLAGNDAVSLTPTSVTNNTPVSGGTPPVQVDTIPPTVTTFSPADGAAGVDPVSNIVLNFSELVQKGASGTIEIHSGSATGALVESFEAATNSHVTVSGNSLTINPTHDLEHDTHYFVTLHQGIVHDLAGNDNAETLTYDFTTNGADPFASVDSNSDSGSGAVLVGVGAAGILAWALFF